MADQRFIDEEQLEGRTVAKVHMTECRVYLLFTDGTWTCIAPNYGWYGDWELCFDEDVTPPKELGLENPK